jgi:hypothetical protein
VTLVLFHIVDLKWSKCLRQSICYNLMRQGSGIGQAISEMRRAPFRGLQVISFLHARTDLAQPIRLLHKGLSQ